ncbi:S-adenosyl-L-methionine-dependent methyltransferase [Exophiala viscosa]|uniref:S-adenosyl-L-methionine-dependent methyltransferase n=1 Tax=Exophiala viscosa TaxID=2486360 RepID=A0AAN6ICY9_9EURO|nr:S-adenosyl-L-methionine-dependent methyltransferase [Exophiala viscosa]
MSNLEATNREHFDKVASNYETDFGDMLRTAIAEFQARRLWIRKDLTENNSTSEGENPHTIRLLDYACGAGTASKALAPYVTQIVGLDLSENMVSEYNKYARSMSFDPQKMQAYRHNLLDETDKPPTDVELANFDVAIISMALHHVSDPGKLVQRLAGCLKVGGVCVVLDRAPSPTDTDLETPDMHDRPKVLDTINQHSFSEEQMRQLYSDAGLTTGFDYVRIPKPFEFTLKGKKMLLSGFFARGERVEH